MKPNSQAIDAYKHMISDSLSMNEKIRQHLAKNCTKFNPELLERCIKYLTECARDILSSKSGDIPDEVCYKICMDYFNDEIWKLEDKDNAEKAEKEAERKRKAEQKAKDAKVKTGDIFSCSIDDIEDDDEDEEPTPYQEPKKPEPAQLSLF